MFHFYMFQSTFYVYCLTSGLFRKEFFMMLRYRLGSSNRRIGIVTQIELTRIRKTRMYN
jgi:hypothetical protein